MHRMASVTYSHPLWRWKKLLERFAPSKPRTRTVVTLSDIIRSPHLAHARLVSTGFAFSFLTAVLPAIPVPPYLSP